MRARLGDDDDGVLTHLTTGSPRPDRPNPADGDAALADESGTPVAAYDHVHVWLRLCESEPPNGQPATATVVSCADGKDGKPTVTMATRSDSKKDAPSVSADGVVASGAPLGSVHDALLAPLVDFIAVPAADFGPGRQSALLCYGEARTGREACLFGAEEALLQGNGNATARAAPASADEGLALVTLRRLLAATAKLDQHTLHAAGCVLTMELLVRPPGRPAGRPPLPERPPTS